MTKKAGILLIIVQVIFFLTGWMFVARFDNEIYAGGLRDISIQDRINAVQEWLWNYHTGKTVYLESKMDDGTCSRIVFQLDESNVPGQQAVRCPIIGGDNASKIYDDPNGPRFFNPHNP